MLMPMMVPMFLPAVAGIIARGAAVLGRFAVGAGRAIASAGGGKLGASIGKAAQRAGVAMQRGAQTSTGSGARRGFGGGLGGNPFGQAGGGSGKRRPVVQRQGGARRRGRGRKSVSFSPAKRRQFRQQMRYGIRRNNVASFVQNLFGRQSSAGKIAQHFIQPLEQGSGGRSGFGGGGGKGIQMAVDPIQLGKDVSVAFANVTKSIVTLPKLIKDWGASLIESKRHLGEFNATYAIAVGRLDIGRRARNVQLGAATGGSFRSLTQSQNRLEEKLLPYQIQTANGINKVVTVLQEIAIAGTTTAEQASNLSPILLTLKTMSKFFNLGGDGAGIDNNPLADFAGAMARGNFTRRVRPPMPGMPLDPAAGGGAMAGGGGAGGGPREARGGRGGGFGV